MRLTVLDGFRGYFLLFMMVAHVTGLVGAPIGAYTHHSIGWVEDAQGFVFVSGLVVGMVYGRRLLRKGAAAMRAGVRERIVKIWSWHAGLVATLLVLALACVAFLDEVPWPLTSYAAEPLVFPVASLMLVASSMHMGILPMYIFFMLVTPLVLRQFEKGRAPVVLIASVMLWLMGQTLVFDKLQYPVEAWLASLGHEINIGIYFDIFSWQVLFFAGLWAGWLRASDQLSLDWLKQPGWQAAAAAGAIGFTALAVFDWAVAGQWLGQDYSRNFGVVADRAQLAPIYVVAFALDLFLVTWLLVAGSASQSRLVCGAARGLDWLMTRPALTLLGRHSLQVFATHIIVTYLIAIWADGRSTSAGLANLVLLLSLVPLYAVAWLQEVKTRRAAPDTVTA